MRTRLMAIGAAALVMAGAGFGVARAVNVPTPAGTIGVTDDNGYIVVVDFLYPLPIGYLGITDDPWCAFGLNGGPYEEGQFHDPVNCESLSFGDGLVPAPPVPVGVPPLPVPVPSLPLPPVSPLPIPALPV